MPGEASQADNTHIPEESREWPVTRNWAPLERLCVGVFDCPHSTPELSDEGPLVVRSQDIRTGVFRVEVAAHVDAETFRERIARAQPRHGDVLYSREGTYFGIAAEVPKNVRVCLGQRMVLIRPRPSMLNGRFLTYWLNSPIMARHIHGFRDGTVAERLNMPTIRRLPVPAFELQEQFAIARILGALDDKIELNRRMNETLEAMARALFKSWFVDFDPVRAKSEGRDPGLPEHIAALFPDRFTESQRGEIPDGWTVSHLGDHVLNFDSRRVPVSGAERAKRQGSYPYHGAAGVMDHVNDYLFDGIYVLVGEDGSVVRESGLAVTQYVWGKIWVNNHAHVLQGKTPVSTEQLLLYFGFEPVTAYVTGAVQPKLSQGRMNLMPFVFAGEAVCGAFTRAVEPLFLKHRRNEEESRTLAAIRDALLPKLISGEIRVKAAERLVADAAG